MFADCLSRPGRSQRCFTRTTGLVTGTIDAAAAAIGAFLTTVTATDGLASASVTFVWAVAAGGSVTLQSPGDQSDAEGDVVSLGLTSSYTGGGTLAFFAQGLPAGLAIDPATGDVTGTIALDTAASGPYTVVVVATDGTDSATRSFTWTVTGQLAVDPVADQADGEGDGVSLQIDATYTGGGTLRYAAAGLPGGLSIDAGTGEITGTVAAGTAAHGPYAVTVTATDGASVAQQLFFWTVTGSVSISALADQHSLEGETVSVSVSTSYSGGGTLTYTARGLPTGLSINPSTGAISGTVSAGAAAVGPYVVAVTAGDGTSSATTTFGWEVRSPITIVEPDAQHWKQGQTITSFAIQASFAGSGMLRFDAELPLGLGIDLDTGVISGSLGTGVSVTGLLQTLIRVTVGQFTAIQPLTWSILAPTTTARVLGIIV